MTPEERERALAAIRAEKAFVKLSPDNREHVLAGLFETARRIESDREIDRYSDRTLRLRNRDVIKTHLPPILKVLDDPVGLSDALHDWLFGEGNLDGSSNRLKAFRTIGRQLLAGVIKFKPEPGRRGRGEEQLRTELTRQAFFELIEILESVGVQVGATGGKGGPTSRLLCRLIGYATGRDPDPETVKVSFVSGAGENRVFSRKNYFSSLTYSCACQIFSCKSL